MKCEHCNGRIYEEDGTGDIHGGCLAELQAQLASILRALRRAEHENADSRDALRESGKMLNEQTRNLLAAEAKLAEREERVRELETERATLWVRLAMARGAHNEISDEQREIMKLVDAAEAKLATARDSVFELAAFLRQECARVAHEKSGDANVGHEVGRIDVLPFVKAAIEGMDMPLHALGVDPSKEQGK